MPNKSLFQTFAVGLRTKAFVPIRSNGTGFMGLVRESFPGAWQKNITCDSRESILAFSAVYACITKIAADIAKLRIKLSQRMDDGTWQEVKTASPFLPVLHKPNGYQNRVQFMICWILSKLTFGNAYVLKQRDQRGIVTDLYVLDPRKVTPLVTEGGDVYYQIGVDHLSGVANQIVVPASEIIHDLMNPLFHPLVGISPIYACGISGTQGNRIQANSAKFFENMSRPSGMLTAPATIADETANRLKAGFEANFGGSNLGRLFVAGDGLKYDPMTIPPVDAQLVDQLRWTVEDVARAFGGIPLYKISSGPMPANNNVEASEMQYYSGTLQILIEGAELSLDDGLSLPSYYRTEFDLDDLYRMDSATRFDAYGKGIGGGWLAPDEVRVRENYPPVAGGGTPYLQQQNYSLAALAKRDAKDDPFGTAKPPPPDTAIAPSADSELDDEEIKFLSSALMMKSFSDGQVARYES